MSEVLLQIRQASIEIEGVQLLDSINLDVHAGEVMALVGPNGAGKSTLLKAISGEHKLSAGSVYLHGQNIDDWAPRELARFTSVLPQKSVLEFPFTAREVIALGRTPQDTGSELDNRIVDQVLNYLDVEHLSDRLYPLLSGGEQQRVQLARVLAQIWQPVEQPRLLILDEPSSYFDLAHQQLLVRLVRELAASNVAIVVVLHDLNLAMSCADSIAVLCCGQLDTVGPPDKVLDAETIRRVFGVNAEFIYDRSSGRRYLALAQTEVENTSGD